MPRIPRPRQAVLPLLGLLALGACGDDGTGVDQDALYGSWTVTSFVAGPDELVNDGMGLRVVLNSDGGYRFEVTSDLVGLCGGGAGQDCTVTGSYAHTSGSVTLGDEDLLNAVIFAYSITGNGNLMTWTGSIDGTPVEITFQRL